MVDSSVGALYVGTHEQEALRDSLLEDAQYAHGGVRGAGSLAPFGSAAVSVPAEACKSPPAASVLPAAKAHVAK